MTLSPSVRMQFNAEKNGIELYFTDKPDVTVRTELKSSGCGWRWGFKSGCWYTKDTPNHRAWAQAFVGRQAGQPAPAPTPAPVITKPKPVAPVVPIVVPQVAPMAGMTPLGMRPAQWNRETILPKVGVTQSPDQEKYNLALRHLRSLEHFMGPVQRAVVRDNFRGEEKEYFFECIRSLAELVANLPQTGETDGQGRQAVAHLHYFAGGQANWYITEKDKGAPDDEVKGVQHQAFGLADLFADGGELGYISIQEILANGGELDFHFKPQTLAEIYAKEETAKSGVVMWQEQSEVEATVEFSAVPAWRQRLRRR
ncbi:MAG TPA: hypothetical protein VNX46_07615 [Candidatus Acidoferrum sp.]|nr:hypothetical protein [Candidatus Acidoferrum sp.]